MQATEAVCRMLVPVCGPATLGKPTHLRKERVQVRLRSQPKYRRQAAVAAGLARTGMAEKLGLCSSPGA